MTISPFLTIYDNIVTEIRCFYGVKHVPKVMLKILIATN